MSEAFDSETSAMMARALSRALARLTESTLMTAENGRAEAMLTREILALVGRGERDEEKIAALALENVSKQGIASRNGARGTVSE